MDDQRAAVPPTLKGTKLNSHFSNDEDDLLEMLWRIQSSRIEEQRSTMPGESTPHIMPASRGAEGEGECLSSEDLFELIFRCQVSIVDFISRLSFPWGLGEVRNGFDVVVGGFQCLHWILKYCARNVN